MGLLDLQKIAKEYRNKAVLAGVSLSIERRERVCLIGHNGSGKTTLIRIAMGLETADVGQVTFARGIKVGYLSQLSDELIEGDHNALFYEKLHVMEDVLRGLEVQLRDRAADAHTLEYEQITSQYTRAIAEFEAMDGYVLQSSMKKILLGLGLKQEALATPLSQLSGGEKMRVALARILLEQPDLLILDEPTNHLDLKAIEWLESYLMRFSGGVLLVSHDRYFLDKVGTRMAELSGGTLVEKRCSYTDFIAQREIEREFYLKQQHNLQIQMRDQKTLVADLKRMRKNKQADSRQKELERLEKVYEVNRARAYDGGHLERRDGPRLQLASHGHVAKEIAWAVDLTKRFGDHTLFEKVNFNLYGGERVALIGPNGCGKTTLLRILRGLDCEFSGEAVLGSWATYAYLGQSVEFEDESLSMLELMRVNTDLDDAQARQHLAKFQFYGDEVNSKIAILSGGERVRLFLAQVMLTHPHVLILDEPTNHLDLASRQALEDAINRFKGTVIAVSHDRYYLNSCVDKLIAFEDGTARVYLGNYDDYLAIKNPQSPELGLDAKGNESLGSTKTTMTKTAVKLQAKKKRESEKALSSKAATQSPKRSSIARGADHLSLEQLEALIAEVEDQIATLEIDIGLEPEGADYVALAHLYQRLEALWETLGARL